MGYDGVVATFNRHNVIGRFGAAKVFERLVKYLRIGAHLYAEQNEGAVLHLPPLAYPAALDVVQYFLSSQHFGVDDGADAHRFEKFAVLRQCVLKVVHSRHRLFSTKF